MYLLHGGTKTNPQDYSRWASMIDRCYNEQSADFENYGKRGINVCDRWRLGQNGIHPFSCFLQDLLLLGPKPTPLHSLDRINNDGNYEPGNIRWATRHEQAQNRRHKTPKRLEQTRRAGLIGGRQAVELKIGIHALSHSERVQIGKRAGKKTGDLMVTSICPYCGKIGRGPAMHRWHFNNCNTKGNLP